MTASVPPRSAAERSVRPADPEVIEVLVRRGEERIVVGVASARFVLQRAAESGSACAALVLGATFDPRYAQEASIFLRIQEWQDTGTKRPTSFDQTSPRSGLTF